MSLLEACKSPEHRTALRLLSVALGGDVTKPLLDDLHATDIDVFVGIVNWHHLHTVLSSVKGRDSRLDRALPEDLWLYLDEMQKANAVRREEGLNQLKLIGELFKKAAIDAVVLKGGADIIDPVSPNPHWRFVSDLDILVINDRMDEARDILSTVGGRWDASSSPPSAETMHHLPPIVCADWDYPVELHRRPGQPIVCQILTACDILKEALESPVPGLRIPCLRHRFIHHVLHTSVGRGDGDRIYLRSILDHASFKLHLTQGERLRANDALLSSGLLHHAERLDALTESLIGMPELDTRAESDTWVRKSLSHFGNPSAKRRQIIFEVVGGIAIRFATRKNFRSHYVKKLKSRTSFAAKMDDLRERMKKAR